MQLTREYRREKVLACVLLHVIEAARPVDLAFDLGPRSKRLRNGVPDSPGVVFLDLLYRYLNVRSRSRCRSKLAGVEWLAAAGWVECGAIQRYLPQ